MTAHLCARETWPSACYHAEFLATARRVRMAPALSSTNTARVGVTPSVRTVAASQGPPQRWIEKRNGENGDCAPAPTTLVYSAGYRYLVANKTESLPFSIWRVPAAGGTPTIASRPTSTLAMRAQRGPRL